MVQQEDEGYEVPIDRLIEDVGKEAGNRMEDGREEEVIVVVRLCHSSVSFLKLCI